MYKIGEFSIINRLTVKTLRHYDEIGLLKPSYIDEMSGYRFYSSDQLPRVQKIIALKQIGFSLNDIACLLKDDIDTDEMINRLTKQQSQIADNIQKRTRSIDKTRQLHHYSTKG